MAGLLRFACRAGALVLALLAARASGVIHDYTVPDGSGRGLRLNVPDDMPVVRGILIQANWAGGDVRLSAVDPELVAFARSMDFCVLGMAYWTNFSDPAQAELAAFTNGLAQLGMRSGHAELVNAPWLPIGHSNGGQISFALNALRPERVIAMVVTKGAYYVTSRPSVAALRTPGLLVAGEIDSDLRRNNIRDLFEGNRARGALWAWFEDEGTGHEEAGLAQLIRPFVEECVRLRLPLAADPRNGPVTLRALAEEGGWLVASGSEKSGWARIDPYGEYPADRRAAGWLPSERVAMLFRAYASYRKATAVATLETAEPDVVDFGSSIAYRLTRPAGEWRAVELFEGSTGIARFTPADPDPVSPQRAMRSGYLSFHAIVTDADGVTKTAGPRRVYVRPSPGPKFVTQPVTQAVESGASISFAVAARSGAGSVGYRWQRNGAEVAGSDADRMNFATVSVAEAGIYQAVATDGADRVSEPAILGVLTHEKRVGAAREVGSDITPVPGGYTYDQMLLEGTSAAVTADPGQITRISFVDLSDDIVQVEFSGAGTLVLTLDAASGPAVATKYRQPNVRYMKGHAGIVIAGADETTNVSVFSVGRLTGLNPALFDSEAVYDGVADIAFIAIASANGKFGSVRTANTSYFADRGHVGIHAPGVRFVGPVYVGDIAASGTATPVLELGSAADVRIAGGGLAQLNARSLRVGGLEELRFVDGTNSHGLLLPAQRCQTELVQEGLDVTARLIVRSP